MTVITPSLTLSWSTGTPSWVDPISSNTLRASAATRRIGQLSRSIAVEPPEPPWSTVISVLPMMHVVFAKGKSSSSDMICRNAVPVP